MAANDEARGDLGLPVELRIPPDRSLVRLARLVASGVAVQAGFDVEEVEDLRIAVDEVCATLLEHGSGPLALEFRWASGVVAAAVSAPVGEQLAGGEERLALSEQILAVVVDRCECTVRDGHVAYELVKRSSPAATIEA